MQLALIVLISLHALAGVFWTGSTFVLARQAGSGSAALFRPQMGAAAVALVTGIALWNMLPITGVPRHVLGVGAIAAVVAAGVQGMLRKKRPATAQRVAAALLAVTVICMVGSRFSG